MKGSLIACGAGIALSLLSLGALGAALYYTCQPLLGATYGSLDSWRGDWVWSSTLLAGALWSFSFPLAGWVTLALQPRVTALWLRRSIYGLILWAGAIVVWAGLLALYASPAQADPQNIPPRATAPATGPAGRVDAVPRTDASPPFIHQGEFPMSLARYAQKIAPPTRLDDANRAILTLTYLGRTAGPDDVTELQKTMDALVGLTDRGFMGADQVRITVSAPADDRLEVALSGTRLPQDIVVIALRLLISANDTPPEAFAELLRALDGDMETARAVFGGIDFDTMVAGIAVAIGTLPDAGTPSLFEVGDGAGALIEEDRITLAGFGPHMPDPDLEDMILTLSGMRAFLPLGSAPEFEGGDEEYVRRGDDLVIDTISIERSCLEAILKLLAPEKTAAL